MTAHATVEERQRCLAAGMNDHIAKPIDPALLIETVGRVVARAGSSRPNPSAAVPAPAAQDSAAVPTVDGLDTADALLRVGGNRALYRKLLRQFVDEQATALEQVAHALAAGDRNTARRFAHTLKGVAGNIGATAVRAASGDLERSINDGSGDDAVATAARRTAAVLDPLIAALREALATDAPKRSHPDAITASTDSAQVRAAAAQLARLLSDLDPEAAEFIESNRPALGALFPSGAWQDFAHLVQGYEFAAAQSRLADAVAQFQGT
jgi:two-component system, sensor histidine kinase and response regulator